MKTSTFSLIFLSLLGVTLPLLMTSSCGRAPIESLEEPGGTINVTGAFSDWTPSTSSFAGGVFLLLDPNTNEVFKSDTINDSDPQFKIENVPVTGKYYGILLDSRFEPRAYLEKTGSDSKKQRVFKLGSTAGNFGTLVVRDDVIASSEHSELEFQANYGAQRERGKWTKIPFPAKFSTAFVPNPDIDGDGIPNVIDTDVDGDEIQNIFDPVTYDETDITDAKIPAQFNYGYGIPNKGFFKCIHTRDVLKIKVSCFLKGSSNTIAQMSLKTSTTLLPQDKPMNDDGPVGQSGDLLPKDSVFTGQFDIDTKRTPTFDLQTIIASLKMKDGSSKSFITTLEPKLPDSSIFKNALINFTKGFAQITVEPNPEFKPSLSKFNVTAELLNPGATPAKDRFGNIQPRLNFSFDNNIFKTESIVDLKLNDRLPDDSTKECTGAESVTCKYILRIRVTAPAALPGLLGSAFEFDSPELTYPPPAP